MSYQEQYVANRERDKIHQREHYLRPGKEYYHSDSAADNDNNYTVKKWTVLGPSDQGNNHVRVLYESVISRELDMAKDVFTDKIANRTDLHGAKAAAEMLKLPFCDLRRYVQKRSKKINKSRTKSKRASKYKQKRKRL